jgi:hypothetical protein
MLSTDNPHLRLVTNTEPPRQEPQAGFCDWLNLDPATLPPRDWLYGRHYLKGAVSATIADGGVGKSTLALTEAIAMVTGRALLGITPNKVCFEDEQVACRVLYYNAEESLAEIQRRVLAICQHFDIPRQELAELTVISGHNMPLVVAKTDTDGLTFDDDAVAFLECCGDDAVILDPFVSVHHCPENDNVAIDAVVKRLGRVADGTMCPDGPKALEIVHHSRKPAQGGNIEIGSADARGASALSDGVRSLRMLNRMTEREATQAKVGNSKNYFRVDNGKANYAAPSEGSAWFQHKSVILPNGDDVGIVLPWHFPGAFEGVSADHMRKVRDLARSGTYRADSRAEEWIGKAVAEVLDLDPDAGGGDFKRIGIILKRWYKNGVLRKVERQDESRQHRVFVEPGDWNE